MASCSSSTTVLPVEPHARQNPCRFSMTINGRSLVVEAYSDGSIHHELSQKDLDALRGGIRNRLSLGWERVFKNPLTSAIVYLSYQTLESLNKIWKAPRQRGRVAQKTIEERNEKLKEVFQVFYKQLYFLGEVYGLKDRPLQAIERSKFEKGVKGLATVLDENNYSLDHLRALLNRTAGSGATAFSWEEINVPKIDDMAVLFKFLHGYYGIEQRLYHNLWEHFKKFYFSVNLFLTIEATVLDIRYKSTLNHYIDEISRLAGGSEKEIVQFFKKAASGLKISLEEEIAEIKRMLNSNVKQIYDRLNQKKIMKLEAEKSPTQVEAYLARYLHIGELLQESIIDYCDWYEEHFNRLLGIWSQAEELMFYLFHIFLNKATVSENSIENGFILFLEAFRGPEKGGIKNGLVRSLGGIYPGALGQYVELNKVVDQDLSLLKNWHQHHRIFNLVGEFLEHGLEVFHEAKEWFAEEALKNSLPPSISQEVSEKALKRPRHPVPLPRSQPSTSMDFSIDEPPLVEEIVCTSEPDPVPSVSVQDRLRSFLNDVKNQMSNSYAKMALHNAIDRIDNLFIELASGVYARSTHQLAEHLDTLLVNLSLAVEQMVSSKVLEEHQPQFQLDANEHFKHDLRELNKRLPAEIRGKIGSLIVAVNGVENVSRLYFSDTGVTKGQRLVQLLNRLFKFPEDENLHAHEELRSAVYSLTKETLEAAFQILFQCELRDLTWEAFWKELDSRFLVRQVQPISSRLGEALPFIGRITNLSQDCLFPTRNVLSSRYLENGSRLLTRLKARLYYAHESSDLRNFTQRAIYTIHMACWSVFIGMASHSGKVQLQGISIGELSKDLWVWVDKLFGDASPVNWKEAQFCNESSQMLSYVRYQRNLKTWERGKQPLWSLGKTAFSPVFQQNQEPGFSFQSGARSGMDMKVYNAVTHKIETGLGLIQKALKNK